MGNNINTNTGYSSNPNNINTNMGTKSDRIAKVKSIQRQADNLCRALQNPGGFDYYCKVGWRLSEAQIQTNLEKALSAKNAKPGHTSAKFFSYLCSIDIG